MTDADEILATLQEIYRELTATTRDLRSEDRLVDDLGIDSLRAMEILFDLEDRYGVKLIDNPRTASVATVGDVVSLVSAVAAEIAG